MSIERYPNLFAPIRIGKTVFRNRIFASPNGCQYLDYGNVPSREGVAFFERKAIGGAAVTVGECIVDSKTGQAHAYQILLDNPQALPPMSSMTVAISWHGAVASVQLQHCGMYSHLVYERGGQLLGPVDAAIPDVHTTNDGGNMVHMNDLRIQIADKKIGVALSTTAKEIRVNGVAAESKGEACFFLADMVIYAVGQKPRTEEGAALNRCAPEFYMIGDCIAVSVRQKKPF